MSGKWTVRRHVNDSTWIVRSPAGGMYGVFVGTCTGHALAVRHATECARQDTENDDERTRT